MSNALDKLRAYLLPLPPGPLASDVKGRAESLLVACWNDLDGHRNGGMRDMKLIGRTEAMRWEPPNLRFEIERHGAMAFGSIYAEIQSWSINTNEGSASYSEYDSGKRRIGDADKPLKVQPLAAKVAAAVAAGTENDELKWLAPNRVRLEVGAIIPASNKETTAARRRRFAAAIDTELGRMGWKRMEGKRNTFEKIDNASTPE